VVVSIDEAKRLALDLALAVFAAWSDTRVKTTSALAEVLAGGTFVGRRRGRIGMVSLGRMFANRRVAFEYRGKSCALAV
jgi:hypothetical protein